MSGAIAIDRNGSRDTIIALSGLINNLTKNCLLFQIKNGISVRYFLLLNFLSSFKF